MTMATTFSPAAHAISAVGTGMSKFFETLVAAIQTSRSAQARMDLMERLNNMTDAQLAELKLTREEIPAYVFRDMYFI